MTSCVCFYGVSLWTHYNSSTGLKLNHCYHKCIKNWIWLQQIS